MNVCGASNAANAKTQRSLLQLQPERCRIGIGHGVEEGTGVENEARIGPIDLHHGYGSVAGHSHWQAAVFLQLTAISPSLTRKQYAQAKAAKTQRPHRHPLFVIAAPVCGNE